MDEKCDSFIAKNELETSCAVLKLLFLWKKFDKWICLDYVGSVKCWWLLCYLLRPCSTIISSPTTVPRGHAQLLYKNIAKNIYIHTYIYLFMVDT